MSLISLCVLLLCIQPFVIYRAMFSNSQSENSRELEFKLSLLVIAPSFIFFYLDIFWYALLLLGGVGILGCLLVKLFESKAKRSILMSDIYAFMIAWLIIFAFGFAVVSFFQFIAGFFEDSLEHYSAMATIESREVKTLSEKLVVTAGSSVNYLVAMACMFTLRMLEMKLDCSARLSGYFLIMLGVVATISPFYSDYYLLSLVVNYLMLLLGAVAFLLYKQENPSLSIKLFFYSYAFLMMVSLTWVYQGALWLFA